jgi:hypothetical protein
MMVVHCFKFIANDLHYLIQVLSTCSLVMQTWKIRPHSSGPTPAPAAPALYQSGLRSYTLTNLKSLFKGMQNLAFNIQYHYAMLLLFLDIILKPTEAKPQGTPR